MSTVVGVEPKGEKAAILFMDDGSKVWTPEFEKVRDMLGKPIPADWTVKQGDYGPQAFPPREKKGGFGGGAPSFRNTAEGQRAEQESIHRSVALTQAVALVSSGQGATLEFNGESRPIPGDPLQLADRFYTWLSRSAPTASRGSTETPAAPAFPAGVVSGGAGTSSDPALRGAGTGDAAPGGGAVSVGDATPSPGQHTHDFVAMEKNPLREMCVVPGCGLTQKKGTA